MHEFAIANGIVNIVLSAHEGHSNKVKKIWVKAGIIRAILPDALYFSFDAIKKNNPAIEDAELCIEILSLSGKCSDCGEEFQIDRIYSLCPKCFSANVSWTGGNELFVEKIELSNNAK